MSKSWFSKLCGYRFVRTTSDWVVKHTNSRTVSAWLCIDLFISLGLGAYYFFFRYVSSLGWVPLRMMNHFKFYVVVAGLRAACTLWGIISVLRRDVKHVKLFYSVFLLNLLVAVWLMVPILSLDCQCTNYYQCEALQSFALDGASLNKIPQPHHFKDRRVPYAEAPGDSIDVSFWDTGGSNDSDSEFTSSASSTTELATTSTTAAAASTSQTAQTAQTQDKQIIDDAKKLADATQQEGAPQALLQGLRPSEHPHHEAAKRGVAFAAPAGHGHQADIAWLSPEVAELPAAMLPEVEMLDDLLSNGHPRLVEKKRRRWKAASLLQLEEPSPQNGDTTVNGQAVGSPASPQPVVQPLQQQMVPAQGLQPMQQWIPMPPGQQAPMYYQAAPGTAGTPQQAVPLTAEQVAAMQQQQQLQQQQQQQMVQQVPLQTMQGQPQVYAPAAVQATTPPPIAVATTTTSGEGTTTSATSADEKAEQKTRSAYDIMGNNFKVQVYFHRVSEEIMIKTKKEEAKETCISKLKSYDQWRSDNFQMDVMEKGEEVSDRDAHFMEALSLCIQSEECYGIRWKLEEVKPNEQYNSTACTLSKPAEQPNKVSDEKISGVRTFYLSKNEVNARDLVRDNGRRASLINQIFQASTPDEGVARTKDMLDDKCLCNDDSCKSYADEDGNERGWCYLDEDTLPRCTAGDKKIMLDTNSKKKWTRDVCHKGANYELSCQCSGIGMMPMKGGFTVNQDLLRDSQFQYGSFCEKWNGDETLFKWCYVGWDSPCVDRRQDESLSKLYEEENVPPQYWSMVACDNAVPNKRLKNAADSCENLEYTADGVCLLHLFLSMPMIACLYNYISNQCGDDFRAEEHFAVHSSSGEEDHEDEFQAGEAKDKGDEAESEGEATVPKFEGATAAKPGEADSSSF